MADKYGVIIEDPKKKKSFIKVSATNPDAAKREIKQMMPQQKILSVQKVKEQSVNQLGKIPVGRPLRRRRRVRMRKPMENYNARQVLTVMNRLVEEWEELPRGWTEDSLRRFWRSLTGDRRHKITQCIKKLSDTDITDPAAFCASLARRVGYER